MGAEILDASLIPPATVAAAQRARGSLRLSAADRDGRSVIKGLYQSGSSKLLFPHRQTPYLEAVSLNTAGGVTGGDQYTLDIEAQPKTHVVLSTQAAERVYRAQPGEVGSVANTVRVGQGARLDWLPQETIIFDRAALTRSLKIDMASDATVLACETLVFGRQAMGETVQQVSLRDRIDLRVDGALAFTDRLRFDGDAHAHLARIGTANGAIAMATLIYAAPDASRQTKGLRAMLPKTGGISALSDTVIVMRILAEDSYVLRQSVVPILAQLNQAALPRTWMI
jgi:urease accessory protein